MQNTNWKQRMEEALVSLKVPCDCPKGGCWETEDGREIICSKCDGSQWRWPEELEAFVKSELLTQLDEIPVEEIKRLIWADRDIVQTYEMVEKDQVVVENWLSLLSNRKEQLNG